MTKEEAKEYIIKHSSKYHLEHECLETFEHFCEALSKRGEPINYYHEAWCALYEWDI